MPSVPSSTICKELGCKAPRSKLNSYCLDHGGKDKYDQKHNKTASRIDSNAMYNTAQWQALRKIQLSKQPLCIGCESQGIVTQATVVDHLFPWRQIGKEAFYINKFQSLCYEHHAEKTQLEQRGVYRRYGKPSVDLQKLDYMTLCA